MKAIILAAGRGSRMKKLTDERPKCLLELAGKALLDWQLEALRAAEIDEISIVTGYKRECLKGRGLVEFHNADWEDTNMLSSLATADEWLESGPCVISYSDIFYESRAVHLLNSSDQPIAITYDSNWLELWKKRFGDPLIDAETFRLWSDNTLAEIGKPPANLEEIQGQYMGLLRFTPQGWNEVKRIRSALSVHEKNSMHMTGVLQKVIENNRIKIDAVKYDGKWGEVDSEDDLGIYKYD